MPCGDTLTVSPAYIPTYAFSLEYSLPVILHSLPCCCHYLLTGRVACHCYIPLCILCHACPLHSVSGVLFRLLPGGDGRRCDIRWRFVHYGVRYYMRWRIVTLEVTAICLWYIPAIWWCIYLHRCCSGDGTTAVPNAIADSVFRDTGSTTFRITVMHFYQFAVTVHYGISFTVTISPHATTFSCLPCAVHSFRIEVFDIADAICRAYHSLRTICCGLPAFTVNTCDFITFDKIHVMEGDALMTDLCYLSICFLLPVISVCTHLFILLGPHSLFFICCEGLSGLHVLPPSHYICSVILLWEGWPGSYNVCNEIASMSMKMKKEKKYLSICNVNNEPCLCRSWWYISWLMTDVIWKSRLHYSAIETNDSSNVCVVCIIK